MTPPKKVEGVGTYTACKILAAIELGRRRQSATMGLSPDLCSATAIYKYMLPKMQDLKVEEAHVILMNQNFRLIKSVRLSQGGISEVSVDIRILLKEAILNNATDPITQKGLRLDAHPFPRPCDCL